MADEENEQKKKEMQQLLSGFLQLKVEKDSEKTKLNAFKVDIQWRDLLREAKTSELKEDLHLMKESFTKAVDYKDSIINSLMNAIQQVEVQNMWTACNHMNSIGELIAIEEQRSKQLQEQYEADIEQLRKSFKEMKNEREVKMQSEMSNFKDLDFIEDSVFQDFSQKAKTRFTLMKEDINEEVLKEKEDILTAFDCKISTTWRQFQLALIKYLEDADAREKLFTELKQEYNKLITDIHQDHKVAEELKKSIPQLKSQLVQKEKDYKERLQKVMKGNENFYNNATILKDKMTKLQIQDKSSLTHLVVNSNAAIKGLQQLHEKGEKILRLYKRCQKLEMDAGISGSPSETSRLSHDEIVNIKQQLQFDIPNDDMASGLGYIGLLQNLWEMQNKVTLRNLALERELAELQLLEAKLKSNMSSFFQKVSDGKMDNVEQPSAEQTTKPLIQEAALMMKNLHLM